MRLLLLLVVVETHPDRWNATTHIPPEFMTAVPHESGQERRDPVSLLEPNTALFTSLRECRGLVTLIYMRNSPWAWL